MTTEFWYIGFMIFIGALIVGCSLMAIADAIKGLKK